MDITSHSGIVLGDMRGLAVAESAEDTRRKRGRPTSATRNEPVTTRIPLPLYDQLVKTALRRDESVSSVVRSLLMTRGRRELL
jgi:hypothetical protein